MEAKALKKEKLLVIRKSRKARNLWINNWLYSPRKLGAFQLTCHLVSLIFFPDDHKTRQTWLHVSAEFVLIYDLFPTVGKHISHVQVSFIFAKFNKHIKLICAKLVFFRLFPIFVSWFYQHTKSLSWQHQVQTHAPHHLQSDPSWISLQANHLNSSNHRTWKRRFWKLVCTTRKLYGDGVQLFLTMKFFDRVHSENVPQSSQCQ